MFVLLRDLRFAFRQLRQTPGFTLAAVLTLGLGIGATTVIFSVVRAVILQPLPFPEPDRLVRIRDVTPQGNDFSTSEPNFLDYQEQSRSFAAMGAIGILGDMTVLGEVGTSGDEYAEQDAPPERLSGFAATGELFQVAGVAPLMGRTFETEEAHRDAGDGVVVLGHDLWVRRFGSDPAIVGRALRFAGGQVRTVVGVMPPGYDFPFGSELWIPFAPDPHYRRGDHRVEAFGRLAPGVTLEQAQTELQQIAARLGEEYPDSNADWSVRLTPLRETMIGAHVTRLNWVLLGAVSLLLLLACANVSNLLLARATVRRRELALRGALGASRGAMLRQLLCESLLLGLMGAVFGLLVASWGVSFVRTLPEVLPRLDEVTIDPVVLLFTLVVSLMAGLFFGTAPALQASRADLAEALQEGGRTAAPAARRLRSTLVVAEMALATVLLVLAGLLARTFLELRRVDPGFDPDGVWMVQLSLPGERYPEFSQAVLSFWEDVIERVEALPGVRSVGGAMVTPYAGLQPAGEVIPEGGSRAPDDVVPVQWRTVTPGFFGTLGIPLLAGRTFDAGDRADYLDGAESMQDQEPPVIKAVLSRTLARRLWGGTESEAVGRRLVWMGAEATLEVVGVVGDYQDMQLGAPPPPVLFVPHAQIPWPSLTLLVRTDEKVAGLASAVRREIWAVDGELAVPAVAPLADTIRDATASSRLSSILMALFAVTALIMAATGIYAVLSFGVTQRRRELGVRIALGAGPGQLVAMVLRQASRFVAVGLLLGVAAALASARLLGSLLYETAPTHPLTYLSVALLLGGVALVASYVPARRATRVDPVLTLNAE